MKLFRLPALLLVSCLVGLNFVSPPAQAVVSQCGSSAGAALCLAVPGGPLAGEVTASATWAGTGGATVEFTLNGKYLNFEYETPYSFVWPTNRELDGSYTLAARVHQGSVYGAYVSMRVTLDNGNLSTVPTSRADYSKLFVPRAGSTFAAVGNAGAEKPEEKQLLNYIVSTRPSAFFYLGEVHEFGTWATRRDHYGLASFDDPAGQGTLWGQMARYTLATPGNHERDYILQYRDYWHHRPLWSTTVVDGVRVYDLTSECRANGGCLAQGDQATWLSAQLAKNTEPCVLSFWHRPLVSNDSKRSSDTLMLPIWKALANNGGDLVLNADTRDMEEVKPMNAALKTGQPDSDMVELVSGAAAARWVASFTSEPRVAWRLYKVPGAVFVTHANNTLKWQFRSSTGQILRSGSTSC